MPLAVAGRCRWVTTPPTSMRRPDSAVAELVDAIGPRRVEPVAQVPDRVVVGRDARGPQVGDHLLGVGQHRQQRRLHGDDRARQVLGASCAASPASHSASPRLRGRSVERAGGGQRLELRRVEARPAGQVGHVAVRPARRARRRCARRPRRRCRETSASPSRTANAPSRRCSAERSARARTGRRAAGPGGAPGMPVGAGPPLAAAPCRDAAASRSPRGRCTPDRVRSGRSTPRRAGGRRPTSDCGE